MGRLSFNLGDSTSWKPQVLSRPVMGYLYLYLSHCAFSIKFISLRPEVYLCHSVYDPLFYDILYFVHPTAKFLLLPVKPSGLFQLRTNSGTAIFQKIHRIPLTEGRIIARYVYLQTTSEDVGVEPYSEREWNPWTQMFEGSIQERMRIRPCGHWDRVSPFAVA
jgi:hypothetical protein